MMCLNGMLNIQLVPANAMPQPVKSRHTAKGVKRLRVHSQLDDVKDVELKAKLALRGKAGNSMGIHWDWSSAGS